MDNRVRKAFDRQRIWRGNSLRRAWYRGCALDRRVPNEPISAPNRDVTENPVSGRNVALGADGFSLAAPPAYRRAGFLQSEGSDFRPWSAQTSLLHAAKVLQGNGSRAAGTINARCDLGDQAILGAASKTSTRWSAAKLFRSPG